MISALYNRYLFFALYTYKKQKHTSEKIETKITLPRIEHAHSAKRNTRSLHPLKCLFKQAGKVRWGEGGGSSDVPRRRATKRMINDRAPSAEKVTYLCPSYEIEPVPPGEHRARGCINFCAFFFSRGGSVVLNSLQIWC